MSEPTRKDAAAAGPPPSVDPTVQVEPPPVPGRAVRAQLAAGELATPPVHRDEPTVTLDGPASTTSGGTLQFDGPPPAPVTADPPPSPRRRWRTWPWIVAVALALVVLGAVLLLLLWRGETIGGDVQFLGGHLPVVGDLVGWSGGTTSGRS